MPSGSQTQIDYNLILTYNYFFVDNRIKSMSNKNKLILCRVTLRFLNKYFKNWRGYYGKQLEMYNCQEKILCKFFLNNEMMR